MDHGTIAMLVWLAVPGNTGKPGNVLGIIGAQSTVFRERVDQLIACLHCRCTRLITATMACIAKKSLVFSPIDAFADHETCVDLGNMLH
jgi:hypothetical protein